MKLLPGYELMSEGKRGPQFPNKIHSVTPESYTATNITSVRTSIQCPSPAFPISPLSFFKYLLPHLLCGGSCDMPRCFSLITSFDKCHMKMPSWNESFCVGSSYFYKKKTSGKCHK